MSNYVILVGYFIPLLPGTGGPRSASFEVVSEANLDSALTRALAYVDGRGFESCIVETVPFEDIIQDPGLYLAQLRERVLIAWQEEHPEQTYREDQNEPPDGDEILRNMSLIL